jgi:tetratricopeptide (TPR) repeat protein
MNATGSVVVRVFDSHNMTLKQQAFVRLYSINSGVLLRGALTNLDGSVSFDNLPGVGWYAVDVSAAGYQTQRKQFQVNDTFTYTEVDVNLLPASGETTLTYMPASDLPGKARKHLDKGILAFRAGKLKQAQKELTDAYNAAPKSAVTNYLLGIFYLQTKDIPDAERYFTSAVSIDPKDVPALIGLAHVRYEKSDLKGSADALQKAIALDGKQWEALWLLAEIDLRQRDFQKAQKEAESAVEFGKGAANGAEFIEAAAFAELGETAQAVKMLQTFLRDAPSDRNAPVARQLAGRLEMELAAATTVAVAPAPAPAAQPTAASHPSVASNSSEALAVSLPKLPLPDWEPAGVDQERPPMADGVTCPAAQVIKEAGERVSELVDSVNRIEATERVTHEELSTLGHPISIEKRKFDYLISIEGSDSGLLMVDEDRQGGGGFLGHISMFGLADLPLIFHPSLRRDFQMTCEGLGKWEGRATWLVYFRQRPDRPEQIRSYQLLDGSSYTAGLKGRAWIAADTYQIVRIEADLMKAIPQIGLGSEEDVIEYAPVPFRSKNTVLWLPSSADIYYFYDHRPYHRHHTFTDYRLFSVSTSQKIGQPNTSEEKNNQP